MFMRFPGGRAKALTLSYDDGVEQDIRLITIMKANGLKGTFNINSELFAPEGTVYPQGQIHRRMTQKQAISLYLENGMEVAVHSCTHPFLEQLPAVNATREVLEDRKNIERLTGQLCKGMAYPFGTYNEQVEEILRLCGIAYSRTTNATQQFGIPTDWLALNPTCHHKDPKLMELAKKFLEDQVSRAPYLFYLWGHAYEFEANDNWNIIEQFAAYTGGYEDVWYATNIEIYDYIQAFHRLETSVDGRLVSNPSARTLWFGASGKNYEIGGGEIITL